MEACNGSLQWMPAAAHATALVKSSLDRCTHSIGIAADTIAVRCGVFCHHFIACEHV